MLANLLPTGQQSGMVYATGVMKGHEALRMIADAKAQETIRTMTARILNENQVGYDIQPSDRLDEHGDCLLGSNASVSATFNNNN